MLDKSPGFMYGIFTYKTGLFSGQMLVNIPYMEHMGSDILGAKELEVFTFPIVSLFNGELFGAP